MIGIIKYNEKEAKLKIDHILGGCLYNIADSYSIRTTWIGRYVKFTLVSGDRYGISTVARVDHLLDTSQVREWKVDQILNK